MAASAGARIGGPATAVLRVPASSGAASRYAVSFQAGSVGKPTAPTLSAIDRPQLSYRVAAHDVAEVAPREIITLTFGLLHWETETQVDEDHVFAATWEHI